MNRISSDVRLPLVVWVVLTLVTMSIAMYIPREWSHLITLLVLGKTMLCSRWVQRLLNNDESAYISSAVPIYISIVLLVTDIVWMVVLVVV